MAVANRSGQILDLAEASKGFLNLVKPQVTTSRADEGDNNNTQALIQSLLASSGDDHQALVDNILKRSAIDFAPTRSAETNSGGYNSTVLQQLQTEARARATGEATGAVLQAQTQDKSIAAQLQANKLQANKTQTILPPTSVGEILKTVAGSVAINKLYQAGLKGATGFFPGSKNSVAGQPGDEGIFGYKNSGFGGGNEVTGESLLPTSGGLGGGEVASSGLINGTSYGDFAGVGDAEISTLLSGASDAALGNSASLTALTDASVGDSAAASLYGDFGTPLAGFSTGADAGLAGTGGASSLGGGAGVVGGGAGAGATGSAAPGAASELGVGSDVLSAGSSSSAIGVGAGEATTAGGAVSTASDASIFSGLGDSAAGFGAAAIPAFVGGTVATQVGTDLARDAFGGDNLGMVGDIGQFFGDIGGGIKNVFTGDTVICTELGRQGKLNDSIRRYNRAWAHKHINSTALLGYKEGWGPMYVRVMQRSETASRVASSVFNSWSKWIRGDRTAILGASLVPLVWIPSWIWGKAIKFRKEGVFAWQT